MRREQARLKGRALLPTSDFRLASVTTAGPLSRIYVSSPLTGGRDADSSAPVLVARAFLAFAAVDRLRGRVCDARRTTSASARSARRENATVKLGAHTYVIPDDNVGLVPNVGIVVGSRATLVIDPGLGRRNGETVLREVAKVSKNTELYIASTHYHAEHTTGYVAFPASAKYVNSTVQEAEFAEGGMQMVQTFSGRSPLTAEMLKDAARTQGGHHVRSRLHARSRRRARALPRRRPDAHARRHRLLRRRRQRAVRRRRRHEQLVPRREADVEHEGLAGGVRHVRGDEAADDRAGARRRRRRARSSPPTARSCRASRRACASSRRRADRPTRRRRPCRRRCRRSTRTGRARTASPPRPAPPTPKRRRRVASG